MEYITKRILEEAKKNNSLALPIQTICNIKVIVWIRYFEPRDYLQLVIESPNFMECGCNADSLGLFLYTTTKETMEDRIKEIIVVLKLLKFSKTHGIFYIPNDKKMLGIQWDDYWIELLGTNDNYTITYEECCVCNEPTKTKTACNHPLCYECASNIDYDKEDEDAEIPCPICRKDIKFGFKN